MINSIPNSADHSVSRIPTVKLKILGKAFLKSESRTSVTFKLKFLTLAIYRWHRLGLSKSATMKKNGIFLEFSPSGTYFIFKVL